MAYLPLANIMHYKLRSALSAAGIGIGICMLVTLSGLARGTLGEVADRWEAVDADLIVYPRDWGTDIVTRMGMGVRDDWRGRILDTGLARHVVPVYLQKVQLDQKGPDQTAVGVDSDQWHTLTGGRQILPGGRLFDPEGKFAKWLEGLLGPSTAPASATGPGEMIDPDPQLGPHGGLELVIDTRLAAKGRYKVGQRVTAANHEWTIVGIVPDGAMGRVFMPRRTAQSIFGENDISRSTLMFVKLNGGVDASTAARKIKALSLTDKRLGFVEAVPVSRYRAKLEETFAPMFRYINIVNIIAMIIAFLFIMVTLYMMVLQRTREIAILKSFGASSGYILRQVLDEGWILTATGTAGGIALSFLAKWLIELFLPLYTVTITWQWVVIAAGVALVGSVTSAIYPAWRATKVDMVEALTLE
ncbi:MAG: ABC transporter permease [Phycisphaerae bacterium]